MVKKDPTSRALLVALCGLLLQFFWPLPVNSQVTTRIILGSGVGVPGYPGFAFGPFKDLVMSSRRQIAFRTVLHSPRTDLRAIVRSDGVSFSVVAFEGLVSPLHRELYESFSAPSINEAGAVAFTAALKGSGERGAATSAVIRVKGKSSQWIAANGDANGGTPGAVFKEFSAPVIGSAGEILFGALTAGPDPGSGLYLSTSQGVRPVPLPNDFRLGPRDLLQPLFSSHDEAVFVRRSADKAAASEQFFRAVAIKNFQQLTPPPDAAETFQVMPPRLNQKPVQMLLVLLEGGHAETAELEGDPTKAVMARGFAGVGSSHSLSFTAIQGQTAGHRSGSVIFAATPAGRPNDFGIFCFCGAEIDRLTGPEDFALLASGMGGASISSFTGDGQHTIAFIAPLGTESGANAIFVTDIP